MLKTRRLILKMIEISTGSTGRKWKGYPSSFMVGSYRFRKSTVHSYAKNIEYSFKANNIETNFVIQLKL